MVSAVTKGPALARQRSMLVRLGHVYLSALSKDVNRVRVRREPAILDDLLTIWRPLSHHHGSHVGSQGTKVERPPIEVKARRVKLFTWQQVTPPVREGHVGQVGPELDDVRCPVR